MYMYTILYFCIIIIYIVQSGTSSITCLECKNLAQPHDCNFVTTCGSHEQCYVDKQLTNDDHLFYNVGCMDTMKCNPLPLGKRHRRSVHTCTRCCNSTLCNGDSHCGSQGFKLGGGRLCFSCPFGRQKEDDCNTITLCSQDQLCQITKKITFLGEHRWVTGCGSKATCAHIPSNSYTDTCVSSCCSGHLCNNRCNSMTNQTSTIAGQPLSTTHGILTTTNQHVTTTNKVPSASTSHASTTTNYSQHFTTVNHHVTTSHHQTRTTTQIPQSPPKIVHINWSPDTIHYGDNVTVTCAVTGNPHPLVIFLYRHLFEPTNLNFNSHSGVLKITIFSKENDGLYNCKAQNRNGIDSKDFEIRA